MQYAIYDIVVAIKKYVQSPFVLSWIGFLGYLISFLGIAAALPSVKLLGLLTLAIYYGANCMCFILKLRDPSQKASH